MISPNDPLSDPLPVEVPLPDAPLVRVIAQVRFPTVLSIEKREFVAPFQEAIRTRYPVLRAEQTRGFILGPAGPVPVAPSVVWRFADVDDQWRVSLSTEFAAIETTAYESRTDLMNRLESVIQALAEHIGPKVVDRLGVRYIDRIRGAAVSRIGTLVRPEMLGVGVTPASRYARHLLSEALFILPDQSAQMLARWGLMPSHGTVDPAAIEPIDEPSWILDLDTSSSEPWTFDVSAILSNARAYAERSYCFFRWAVTDEFLRIFGGNV